MANTLTPILGKILARAHMVLRKRCILPQLVNSDFGMEVAKKGSTIDVPIPAALSASDVTPAAVPPTPADSAPTTVQVPLSNWKKVNFHVTDKEKGEMDANGTFVPMQMEEAVSALADAVSSSLWTEYKGVYGYVGVINGTIVEPFASDVTAATNLKKVLNQQKCPRNNRYAVIDFDAEANAGALQQFSNFQNSADPNVMREGLLGRKYGFDWYSDDDVPLHTAGTLSDGTNHKALTNGAQTVGLKTINIDSTTLTGTVVPGDIFTVAGDPQTYVVTNGPLTASGNAITGIQFEPGAKVAWADNSVISFANSHISNMGFHRDAFAFANRPLEQTEVERQMNLPQLTMQDPVSKIAMRLEVLREYKQTVYELDLLWGVKLVRRELASRLAGLP